MFWKNKNSGNNSHSKISELEALIENQKRVIEEQNRIIDSFNDKNYNAESIVNWDNINAFSVERNGNKTVVGYYLFDEGKNKVKEWYFNCSVERHQEIVNQFRDHINSKKVKA